MSIISAVRDYLLTYGEMSGALIHVDALGKEPIEYAVIPVPGARTVEEYLDGKKKREFPFLIQSVFSTADEAERLENSGFYESLADWFEAQTAAGNFPNLGTGKIAESIESVSWAFLYEQGESATGIYQITCKLIYEQE
ncbi:MAG: hypothetical protein IPL32_18110 [Chloracidobacterium sp.]|nr:hypothetical protein [Chloracidobacterium sp.]